MKKQKKIKVLVVDDSAVMRGLLSSMLSDDKRIDVIGLAEDPYEARKLFKKHKPDVMTLDVEMPRMDGLSFLKKIMNLNPIPVIMISSLTSRNSSVAIEALENGAFDCLKKPIEMNDAVYAKFKKNLIDTVVMARDANFNNMLLVDKNQATSQLTSVHQMSDVHSQQIIAIGGSTGAVDVIRKILRVLPAALPPIVIAQHILPEFTAPFAEHLHDESSLTVQEAEDGQKLCAGHVYLAPGGKQLGVRMKFKKYVFCLTEDETDSVYKPSIDVLFNSIANIAGEHTLGVLLTGMGKDGAQGMSNLFDAGAYTVAQNKESSLIWGMPKVATELGCVKENLSVEDISKKICLFAANKN